jgi:hypothetical protein
MKLVHAINALYSSMVPKREFSCLIQRPRCQSVYVFGSQASDNCADEAMQCDDRQPKLVGSGRMQGLVHFGRTLGWGCAGCCQ